MAGVGAVNGCAVAFRTAITRQSPSFAVYGLRLRGVVATKTYDRAMDAKAFEAWLVERLLPSLEEDDILALDNLQAHKSPRVAEMLNRKSCAVRYLPPYSPGLNPIEKAFSRLKAFLRKLAERTVAGLIGVLAACADLFEPSDCESYFESCGSDPVEVLALDTT